MKAPTLACLSLVLLAAPRPQEPAADTEAARAAVEAVLDDFQAAGRAADLEGYVGQLAPDAVYLGTDPAERHTRDEVRALVAPYFERGSGLASRVTERHVFLSDDARTAWFDARLERPDLGELRATGVLRQRDGAWRIVQYSVSLPVPNEAVRDVAERIGR